jgi:hypothetical protein
MINVVLTEDMIFAMKVALDELSNSAEWTNYLSKAEYDSVRKGIEELQFIYKSY